jgi:alpha-glucosidase
LSDPCALDDTSWIQPGISAWDRWWSGDYAPDTDFEIAMNTATMKYFIDFAAEMGWEYQIVDWQWYGNPFDPNGKQPEPGVEEPDPNPAGDITKVIPEVDMAEIISYATAKNVKIFIWAHWKHVDNQLDEAFALYETWGVSGVKIDFMDRDDQYMVNFYHRVLQKAAQHKLLINFHGAYKPTGLNRTYPNYISQEGVMGNEYSKWSDLITPLHTVTLAFTRMLAGPLDFTPGGFRNATEESFKVVGSDAPGPYVMGTRCHQLAMTVVYESPMQVLCDSPYNYRNSPAGLDFLKIVPATWDETKVLAGDVGEYIVIARRSERQWFIGAMTNWTERNLDIPLDFLDAGRFQIKVWADADEAHLFPDRIQEIENPVTAKDTLTIKLAPGGGFVAQIL